MVEKYNIPQEYKLRDTLIHENLFDFIMPWMKKNNIYTRTYNYLMLGGLTILGGLIGFKFATGTLDTTLFTHLFLGFALTFLLIPFHEALHGIAYKIAGAQKVTYKAHWKKLTFYAIADKFPIGYKPFRYIALLPFIVITTIGIIMIFIFPEYWVLFLGILLAHSTFCGGDFALLSYMYIHRHWNILTVDDVEEGKSFFFVHINKGA